MEKEENPKTEKRVPQIAQERRIPRSVPSSIPNPLSNSTHAPDYKAETVPMMHEKDESCEMWEGEEMS